MIDEQITFLSSILAGFSITIVAELISLQDKRKITSWVISIFVVSASLFLVSTFSGSVAIVMIADLQTRSEQEESLPEFMMLEGPYLDVGGTMLAFFSGGVALFLVGIGLMGWIRSPAVGAVSVVIAVISFIVMMRIGLWMSS